MFKSTNQTKIVILKASGRVFKAIVEESIRASILHKRLEASTTYTYVSQDQILEG